MGFHFSTRIFRRPLFKTQVIFSPFSTFSAENRFYRENFPHIFQECSKKKALQPGKQAHARMIVSGCKPTVFYTNCLLQMHIKCSLLGCAAKLFDKMPERSCVSWTAMIFGYSVIGKMELAQSLFDVMPDRDAVSWNSLISGYLRNGNCLKSIEVFVMMGRDNVAYDKTTFLVVLKACEVLKDYVLGKQVHGVVVKSGFENHVATGNTVLDMYAKCSMLDESLRFFDAMPLKDGVSWCAIIAGCVQNDEPGVGLELFKRMQREGVVVNGFVYSTVVNTCSRVANVGLGKQIHAQIIKHELQWNVYIVSTLVDMYSKCGYMQDSVLMFQKSSNRNVVTWNTMISAYAHNGYGNEAFQVFERMLREKVMPDHATFLSVLHACAHNGLVDEARHYLYVMHGEYGLKPRLQHYACVVDALGRRGRVTDALKLIEDMPLKANDVIWQSLLSSCKMQRNVEVAEIAARSLVELDPRDVSAYVLLSDIYAESGMWREASETRRKMRSSGVKKQPGCSWIEVQGEVHMFVAGDEAHPRFDEMYEKLYMLMAVRKSDVNAVMHHFSWIQSCWLNDASIVPQALKVIQLYANMQITNVQTTMHVVKKYFS